jgi:hypothetical protein
MSDPTDDQVWQAFDAFQDEAEKWRVIPYAGGTALAVRDRFSVSKLPPEPVPETAEFERIDFKDAETAQRYVAWRAMKVALSTYGGTGHE